MSWLAALKLVGRFLTSPAGMALACIVFIGFVHFASERHGYGQGVEAERAAWDARLKADAAKARATEARQAEAGQRVETQVVQAQAEIRYRTEYLTREVVRYVPIDPARAFLPVGLVRVHDAAALGVPVAPDPAGRPDGEPSGVDDIALGETVVANYGACHGAIEQLKGWQAWAREVGLAK